MQTLDRLVGTETIPDRDPFWEDALGEELCLYALRVTAATALPLLRFRRAPQSTLNENPSERLEFNMAGLQASVIGRIVEERCAAMMQNCRQSQNFRNMLIVVCRQLESAPRDLQVAPDWLIHLLFLTKVFCKYFIEVCSLNLKCTIQPAPCAGER